LSFYLPSCGDGAAISSHISAHWSLRLEQSKQSPSHSVASSRGQLGFIIKLPPKYITSQEINRAVLRAGARWIRDRERHPTARQVSMDVLLAVNRLHCLRRHQRPVSFSMRWRVFIGRASEHPGTCRM